MYHPEKQYISSTFSFSYSSIYPLSTFVCGSRKRTKDGRKETRKPFDLNSTLGFTTILRRERFLEPVEIVAFPRQGV